MPRVTRARAPQLYAPRAHQLDIHHPRFWDPTYFLPHTMIRPKKGGLVPFDLNPHQFILAEAVDNCRRNGKWLCHLKARQEGASTELVGILMQHVMFRREVTAGILSNKRGGSLKNLIEMAKRFWSSITPALQPHRPKGHTHALEFPELGSNLVVDSAYSDDPFRGYTLQALFADEISSYRRGSDVWAAALSAIPSPEEGGFVMAASTPKHYGDEMYLLVEESHKPDSPWHFCFIPWFQIMEYYREPTPGWICPAEIVDYANRYKLTPGQAYWVSTVGLPKVRGDWAKFLAEYPPDPEVCFTRSGSDVFDSERLLAMMRDLPVRISSGVDHEEELVYFARPHPHHTYLLTVDPASSFASADYWGLVVMDLTTGEQVVDFQGKRHAALMADLVDKLSQEFNHCRIYVESNGVGDALLSHLTLRWMGNRLYTRYTEEAVSKPGWTSNVRTKAQAEGHLQSLIYDGSWKFKSRRAIKQLLAYRGGWGRDSRDDNDGHFDLVAALGIAAWAFMLDRHSLRAPEGPTAITPASFDASLLLAQAQKALCNGQLPYMLTEGSPGDTPFGTHR